MLDRAHIESDFLRINEVNLEQAPKTLAPILVAAVKSTEIKLEQLAKA